MESNDDDLHPIFKHNPAEWMQYVNSEVCVSTEDGQTHTGWVYTIDPVSGSVVLAKFSDEDKINMTVVMGHAIQNIVILNVGSEKYKDELDALFKSKELLNMSPEDMKNKQDNLKNWLLKNRIPIEVSGENSELLTLSDALTIEPPYQPENCTSTNEIILGRIQGLIKNMPPDVQDW